jgi:hypothetical protein
VRDATARPGLLCPVDANPKFVRPARPRAPRVPRARTVSLPVPAPAAPPIAPRPVPAPTTKAKPQPGLAVVALGGAPAGGGGPAADLVRGRAPVAGDPCGGPDHDMSTVSGIVPDGVSAAFLTSPDGTAVRADVKDNAYAFVVPLPKAPEQRYVVWTGGDGTPHVSPVPSAFVPAGVRCAKPAVDAPRVTPDIGAACGVAFVERPGARRLAAPSPQVTVCEMRAVLATLPVRPPTARKAPRRHR